MPEKSLDQTDSVLDSPTPLSDVHLQTAISELEAEIDVAKGRQRDLDETRSRIEKLNLQLQQAKRETEEARDSMDVLRIEEARVRAELEVTKAQRQRAEQETKAIQPVINEFRQGVERAKISLQDARHKLKSAKALRDAEKSEIEKIKQALYAAVALEAQIQAETEAARSSAERDRQQTEEIQSRLQNLREQSEKIRLSADQAQIELQSSRVAESKIQVSEEYLPEERILETDNSQGENIDQVDGLSQELTTSLSRSASRLAMLKEILPENKFRLLLGKVIIELSGERIIKIDNLSDEEINNLGVLSWPIWTCDVSEFDWEYGEKESCLLLEGEVEVKTNIETVNFSAGDFVVFPSGLKCRWKVIKPVRKHYTFN